MDGGETTTRTRTSVAAMPTLAQALVAVASVSFITTVFTRSPAFSTANIALFWLLIFGEHFYGDAGIASQYWVNYFIAVAIIAAAVAVMLVKLLGTGRLIDVWLTRSPLPMTGADWNLPVFVLAFASAFLAAFFFMQFAVAPAAVWHNAEAVAVSAGLAMLLAIVFAALTLLLVITAALQTRTTADGTVLADKVGLYYFVAWLAVNGIALTVWLLPNWTADNRVLAAWVTGVVAAVLDFIALGAGYAFERGQAAAGGARETNEVMAARLRPYDGLFTGGSGWLGVVRVLLIGLTHGLIFVMGGLSPVVLDNGGPPVHETFWFPNLALLFAIALGVYGVAYFIVLLLVQTRGPRPAPGGWAQYMSRGTPLASVGGGGGRRSPPNERADGMLVPPSQPLVRELGTATRRSTRLRY